MGITFPGESAEYRAARDRLLADEIELRRATERVAAARRALPPGGAIPEDYVFEGEGPDGAPANVKLSELFAPGKDSLVVYTAMFPRDSSDMRPGPPGGKIAALPMLELPCPSCSSLLDQLEGTMDHASQRLNLVIVARWPLENLLTFAEEKGWTKLRFLSAAANSYVGDYHGLQNGEPIPILNVFHRDGDTIRHTWGSELMYAPADPGEDPRHLGTIEPLWNIFDLIPEGRGGDWDEQLDYSCCSSSA